MKRYLLCKLYDEQYTDPYFNVYDVYKQALDEVIEIGTDFIKEHLGGSLVIGDDKKRIDVHYGSEFLVFEIKEVDLDVGDCVIVWHHAYNGVDFRMLFQGTAAECVEKRKELIKKAFEENDYSSGNNTDFDMGNDTCIDTGIEYEMYSIVSLL